MGRGVLDAPFDPKVAGSIPARPMMNDSLQKVSIRGDQERHASWAMTAEAIRADILEHGVDERGCWAGR